jgi:GTP-binding protein
VADYPFTTLYPNLGVVSVGPHRSFVVADIPGLIEGASDGAGLGDRFLRHIERTRVLIHLIDGGALLTGERDPLQGYDAIRSELGAYSPAMLERTELVAVNKSDLFPDSDALDAVTDALRARGLRVFRISGVTGEGLEELMRAAADAVDAAETEGSSAAEASA